MRTLFFVNGGNDEAVLDYWQFTTFTLRFCFSYEKQHFVRLFTGTAFRFANASLQPCQNPPNSQKAFLTTGIQPLKKSPCGLFFNGGVDASRFELFMDSYINHLYTSSTGKICSLILKLQIPA